MKKLYSVKSVDEYIRKDLKKSVRGEIHKGFLDDAIKGLLKQAKDRSELAGKKTILKEHL